MDRASANQWLDRYADAWRERDPDAAGALFAPDAVYTANPFEDPIKGREAIRETWAVTPGGQKDAWFEHELLAAGATVVALWRAGYTHSESGERVSFDGVFALQLTPDGLCHKLREWWYRHSDRTN